jgi:chorismate mutase
MRGRRVASQLAEKFLNFIIAEVIRHHEQIADEAVTSNGASDA